MDGAFELWDVESGNIIGSFETLDESLGVIWQLLDWYGQTYTHDLSLIHRASDGEASIVGEGDGLITLARPQR